MNETPTFDAGSKDWPSLRQSLALSVDAIHIVRLNLNAEDDEIARLQTILSDDEIARAERYKIERARRHFIVSRAGLRKLLAGCLNLEPKAIAFEYGPHGKPSLAGQVETDPRRVAEAGALNRIPEAPKPESESEKSRATTSESSEKQCQSQLELDRSAHELTNNASSEIDSNSALLAPRLTSNGTGPATDPFTSRVEFSISHSADEALIVVTLGRRIGIDLEQIDPSVRILKLAERFFSTREADELKRLPESDQLAGFFRGWTSKEAYLKATGHGLSFPLNKFSVSLNPHTPARLCEVEGLPDEPLNWKMESLNPPPGFAAAILYEAQPDDIVTLQHWTLTVQDL